MGRQRGSRLCPSVTLCGFSARLCLVSEGMHHPQTYCATTAWRHSQPIAARKTELFRLLFPPLAAARPGTQQASLQSIASALAQFTHHGQYLDHGRL